MAEDRDFVKIRFRLERDADGWPPVGSEGLWAVPLGNDVYRLDNSPWFVPSVSAGDDVHALSGDDGELWAIERVRRGGSRTVRLILNSRLPFETSSSDARSTFEALGATTENFPKYRMVAIDIPPGASAAEVKHALREGESLGLWHYEESDIPEDWPS